MSKVFTWLNDRGSCGIILADDIDEAANAVIYEVNGDVIMRELKDWGDEHGHVYRWSHCGSNTWPWYVEHYRDDNGNPCYELHDRGEVWGTPWGDVEYKVKFGDDPEPPYRRLWAVGFDDETHAIFDTEEKAFEYYAEHFEECDFINRYDSPSSPTCYEYLLPAIKNMRVGSKNLVIEEITSSYVKFNDETKITFDHDPDCCENNYADFEQIMDMKGTRFIDGKMTFEKCTGGFRFGTAPGNMIFVPCYSEQNGYYTTEVDIYYDGIRVAETDGSFVERD